LIAKRSTNEEPGIAGLFLLGQALELRIATRMICFSSRSVAEDAFREQFCSSATCRKTLFPAAYLACTSNAPVSEKAIASRSRVQTLGGSYPAFLNRKKRARLITYRHSASKHFQNTLAP
jgi:hypothetical protein